MFRLLMGAGLLLSVGAIAPSDALAQVDQHTPWTGLPTVPKTLPVIGGTPFPIQGYTVPSAAATDKPDYVNYLIASGNSPDDTDKEGRTGLMYAAMSNYADIAETLIEHAAKLDLRDNLGYTALHWAVQRGNTAIMRLLLAAKAFVDPQNAQGITPLMLATSNGNVMAVRLLLQNHADPLKQDYTGRDALGWAGDRAAIVELLKNAKAR